MNELQIVIGSTVDKVHKAIIPIAINDVAVNGRQNLLAFTGAANLSQADSKVASASYHHWKEDIDLMKELGLKTYRFWLSLARIILDGDGEINQAGIDFYNKVIDYLIDSGITPFVALYHFDLPYTLVEKYNGWEDRDCAFAFERYEKICFENFGDKVKYWQTHND